MTDITIFTPTYNRKETLSRLYESLLIQSNKNFVWLLVDDGSTDGTYNLIKKWINSDLIKIDYYFQENQGKSMAHNLGVKKCNTELFTCVDSDDFLVSNAIEQILTLWDKSTKEYTGILAFKNNINSNSKNVFISINSSTLKDLYKNKEISGDVMLIYKTKLIKKYSFPKFKNEKFVPEAYLYDLLDLDGKLLILNSKIYCYEYLSDGYTKNINKLIANNPNGYLTFAEQRIILDKKLIDKFFDIARAISVLFILNQRKLIKNHIFLSLLAYPLGYFLYIKRFKKWISSS